MVVELYSLRTTCPVCGSSDVGRSAVMFGIVDIPEEPDVPWVKTETEWDRKRWDKCSNGHYFNIRPYADYDKHYIYHDQVLPMIEELQAKLAALEKLRAQG